MTDLARCGFCGSTFNADHWHSCPAMGADERRAHWIKNTARDILLARIAAVPGDAEATADNAAREAAALWDAANTTGASA